MQKETRLVIIGAGIVGSSAAYHLTQMGWRDILVLDKGDLAITDGSSSHAPGGVVSLSHNKLLTDWSVYSSDLYASLEPYTDTPESDIYGANRRTHNPVGSLEVALTKVRFQDLLRESGAAKAYKTEAQLLTPEETQAKVPLLNAKEIEGSLFIPKSSLVGGSNVTSALARDAVATGGASFVGNTEVTELVLENGRVKGVKTNNPDMPDIACEQVLVCSNIWAPVLGDQYGVKMPLMAFEHQYAITGPLDELSFDPDNPDHEAVYPTMREMDSAMYFRNHWNAMGIGNYRHRPLMVRPKDVKKTAIHPFTPQDFDWAWQQATKLFPALQGKELVTKFNGMFAFSIDGMPIMGESHIGGLWTCVASWITHAGGVGKSIAEWMTTGETEYDMRQCHIHRFGSYATTQKYVELISSKNYREVYDIVHPKQPPSEPRGVRLSPFAPRLDALGANYTVFAGLELPNWFESNAPLLETYEVPGRTGWAAEHWSPIQGAEHIATRTTGAMFDLTGLSILELKGPGALDYVNRLCSNQMNKPVGSVVYTCWLTPSGGVKRDLAVARLNEDRFWMFVGEGTRPQDLDWVVKNAPAEGVIVNDVSDSYTAIGLWGPNARKVLERVTSEDVSDEGFPYFSSRWLDVGMARVLALRLSYAGELGWELHIPSDQALPVWDTLWAAGRDEGIIAAGLGAFDSLRLEKGYRGWGSDVHTEYNPYEAGLGWTVRTKKSANFIGQEACQSLRQAPLDKKLCCLTLDDPEAVLLGYEPILNGEKAVGYVTSANYGYCVKTFIAYGYLPTDLAKEGTKLEVEYLGRRFSAVVADEPLFDKEMARLKS